MADMPEKHDFVRHRRILRRRARLSPKWAHEHYPASANIHHHVLRSRQMIEDILSGSDPRMLMVAGPCSVHSQKQMRECADWMEAMQRYFGDKMAFVLRFCVEKPRSTGGWEGFILTPNGPETEEDEEQGIASSRQIAFELGEREVPLAMEFLRPDTAQMLDDLVSLGWIGARSVSEHNIRRFASGVSTPVGFKNAESGELKPAIQGMQTAARSDLTFRGIDDDGLRASLDTTGNEATFVILRGGSSGKNATPEGITAATEQLDHAGLPRRIVVDCSHGNSSKDRPEDQLISLETAIRERNSGQRVLGAMLEVSPAGVSYTDPCINFEQATNALKKAHYQLPS